MADAATQSVPQAVLDAFVGVGKVMTGPDAPDAVKQTWTPFAIALGEWGKAISGQAINAQARRDAGPFAGVVEKPINDGVGAVVDLLVKAACSGIDPTKPAQ